MKTKSLTFLLSLTFLFLFSGSVYGDDFIDGRDAYQRKDYNEAVRLYRLSAEQGNAGAQYNLGLMYDNGKGIEQNYKEAMKWYQLAAGQGNSFGQNSVGGLYANGQGVLQDYKEAMKWFKLAADQGNEQAKKNFEIVKNLEKQLLEKK